MTGRAYRVSELAELWGTTPKRIYELIREGNLRAFSISTNPLSRGGIRISEEAKTKWETERARANEKGKKPQEPEIDPLRAIC